ncbi:coiled-coil domain-containing protein 14 isoform X1 [Xenopus laevis]|nr:coiled-coil domain-containing protein 14 isoform X1 [Xenopus laevis]
MAKAGGRAGKVVSSGRLTGPVRLGIGKKRVAVRKVSTTCVDSGYSLCSTDSEDQVLVINKGLDRCAALLQDILQHDMRGNSQSHPTQGPVHTVKSSSVRGKRNLTKKPGAASHVHKEIGHLAGSLKKNISSNGFSIEKAYPSVQAAAFWANSHSPITQPAVCENVSTQMSHLNQLAKQANCQGFPPPSSQAVNEQGIGGTTHFNCRLPSSTPALSPQLPGSASNVSHNQVLPQGGTTHIPSGSYAAVQSAPAVMCNAPTPVQQTPAVPTCYPLAFQADTLPQISNIEKIRESNLLQCIAAHLAQLRCSEAEGNQVLNSKPAPVEYESEREQPTRETDETSSEEEDAAPARNISCQTSFDVNKKCSPEKTERKIKTVKYLLGEIKALVAEQGDGEAFRLITELEHNLSLLPAVVGSTNVHAEIALALQPLRSENAQLRRRLRILNQQLRDRERAEKAGRSDEQNFEMISLHSMNVTLQHQLAESQKGLDTLQTKNEELLKAIEAQRHDNKNLTQHLQDKEQDLVQLCQQREIAATKGKTDLDEALGKMRSIQFKLESSEKENQILGITLRQRDAEVSRLQELTRTLQASMAKLLCDLSKDSSKLKPGLNLTKSVLDSYEQQLQGDQCLASTSIMSYLKTLETEQVLPIADATFPDKHEPCNPTSKCYNKYMSDLSENLIGKMPETLHQTAYTPVLSHSPEKLKSKANSVSAATSCDEYKPGDTVYLPLTSSPQKCLVVSSQRQMCTPPQVGIASSDLEVPASIAKQLGYKEPEPSKADFEYRMGLVNSTSTLEPNLKSAEGVLPMGQHTVPGNRLPIHRQISNLQLQDGNPTDHSMFDFHTGKSDWSMSSFSTFTSHDEQDFRNGLAALDANIARLQRTLQTGISRK